MANWNNYSLGSQVPFGAVNPSMVNRTEVPAATPSPTSNPSIDLKMLANPLALLGQLGKGGSPFSLNGVNTGGPFGNLLGGILSPLFGGGQNKVELPKKTVIDQRPADIQALVSMFSNGGMK